MKIKKKNFKMWYLKVNPFNFSMYLKIFLNIFYWIAGWSIILQVDTAIKEYSYYYKGSAAMFS